jgi:ribonuclease Y
VHAIEAHHYEVEPQTGRGRAADRRRRDLRLTPGRARREPRALHQRLESLEELAAQKPGVEKVYALQAGREIRVIVKPGEVDDDALSCSRTRSHARSRTSSSIPAR